MKSTSRKILRSFIGKSKTLEKLYGEEVKIIDLYPSETVETPEAMGMPTFTNPGEFLLKGKTYQTPDLFTVILKNVLYSPTESVLMTPSRNIIAESLITGENSDLIGLKRILSKPIETIPGYSCIFRGNRPGFYHNMISEPPRLFLLNHGQYEDIDEIKLLCPGKMKGIEKISFSKFAPANAKPRVVEEDCLYHLETAILPSFATKRSCGYLPKPFVSERNRQLFPERPSQKNRRFLISRIQCSSQTSTGRGRHIENEDRLMEALSRYGFEKYVLENLSFEEQQNLFYDADIIVAAHGAGLANLIYSDQASVLELHPRNIITPTFYYLCKSLGHDYKYWSAHIQAPTNTIDFAVDVSAVLELLADWL